MFYFEKQFYFHLRLKLLMKIYHVSLVTAKELLSASVGIWNIFLQIFKLNTVKVHKKKAL